MQGGDCKHLPGLFRRLPLTYILINWRNMYLVAAACTVEYKNLLPALPSLDDNGMSPLRAFLLMPLFLLPPSFHARLLIGSMNAMDNEPGQTRSHPFLCVCPHMGPQSIGLVCPPDRNIADPFIYLAIRHTLYAENFLVDVATGIRDVYSNSHRPPNGPATRRNNKYTFYLP